MRIERSAKMIEPALDSVHELTAADDGAGNDIGMSVEVFRTAVQREVYSRFCRTEVDRARKRVVDHGNQSIRFRKLNEGPNIRNVKQRVRHCFEIDRFCCFPEF